MQYYRPVVISGNDLQIYDNSNLMTLSDFNRLSNTYVNSIAMLIYKSPKRIYWFGSRHKEMPNHLPEFNKNAEWDSFETTFPPIEPLSLSGKYLLNVTKKKCLNLNRYKDAFHKTEPTHPLVLLTAVGNQSENAEDYHGTCTNSVGIWAGDLLMIGDEAPLGFLPFPDVFMQDMYEYLWF